MKDDFLGSFPLRFAVVFMIACGILGCGIFPSQDIPDQDTTTILDDMPSYRDFVSSNSFPYSMTKKRMRMIRKNYTRLSLGMSKDEVLIILGAPDYSRVSMMKLQPIYVGSTWIYFLKKPDPDSVNVVKDKSIQVFYDVYGKSDWIVSNIEGLKEIGGPGG